MAMDPRTRALLDAPIGSTLLRLALPNFRKLPIEKFLEKYEAANAQAVAAQRQKAAS